MRRFFPSRGLRQGDPISPLLVVIAIERLSHCIQDAVNNGTWCPLKFGRGGPSISHLLFTDDILLVAEATSSNAHVISDIIDTFGSFTGQTVNKGKVCVLFSPNTPSAVAEAISTQLGIVKTDNLGRYLGIPIISGRKGKEDFSFLVDKVRSKLSGRKAYSLSQAGRISLTQSSIFMHPKLCMQTCKLPASICDEIERLCRDFIWASTPEARKHHLISWETICTPKEEGGFGFRSLRLINAAYMMKLGWGLVTHKDALWAQVLRFKYGCGNLTIPTMKCATHVSHLWRGICNQWPLVDLGILWVIKSGKGVQFWHDP